MAMILVQDNFELTSLRRKVTVQRALLQVQIYLYVLGGRQPNRQSKSANLLPPLPEGKIPPPGVSIPNAISQTLQAYPPQQLTEMLSQLKAVATNHPEQGSSLAWVPPTDNAARQLLTSQPQLAYATFQAMLMMNLVDPSVLQHVVSSTGHATQPAATPPQTYAPPPPMPNVDPQRVLYLIRLHWSNA